jgi:hypothetical protein
MIQRTIFICLVLLVGSCICPTSATDENCNWTKGSYNTAEYIRVIRKPVGDVPLHFMCWKLSQLQVMSVFMNIKEGC